MCIANATIEPEERGRIKVTSEMIRAGVGAYLRWDANREEPECLVAEIFYTMIELSRQRR
jgi:hypothetical protein